MILVVVTLLDLNMTTKLKATFVIKNNLSIYLSGLVTAVAIFRNPNTIPFCLTT